MSHAVYKFEYNVNERIEALRDILVQDSGTRVVPSQVRREWAYRAQLVLEPVDWHALWRLSSDTCKQHGVRFPCVVYVRVVGVNLDEHSMSADVQVLGVQDDEVHLPEEISVPLEQLWPLLAQPNAAISVRPTAEFIDLYRYFYTMVWMPWDLEEDEHDSGVCWFEMHVPARCRLWAASYAGRGCPPHVLHTLRDDGEIVRRHIASIEESISSDNEQDDLDGDTNAQNVSTLMSLHEQLHNLRARWELLQNPALQNLWGNSSAHRSEIRSEIITVWNGGPIKAHIEFLKSTEKWLKSKGIESDKRVDCSPSMDSIFGIQPKRASFILLCDGTHLLPRNFTIGDDLKLSSVSSTKDCVLKCADSCTTAVSVNGPAELNNLHLDPGNSSTGVTVRSGALVLNSCRVTSSSETQSQAAVVFDQAEIICNDCTIDGFFTGFVMQQGSKITMNNCTMKNCGVMLQIYEGAQVILNKSTFENCTEAAIRYETTLAKKTVMGGVNALAEYSDIKINNCHFVNEKHNDVLVTRLDELICSHFDGDVID